ncbi:MAG: hypothetical protein IPJ94_31305 [Chloroflexi bacterium]|nr:hypothetical protein [Chloroflexota bacterium]
MPDNANHYIYYHPLKNTYGNSNSHICPFIYTDSCHPYTYSYHHNYTNTLGYTPSFTTIAPQQRGARIH